MLGNELGARSGRRVRSSRKRRSRARNSVVRMWGKGVEVVAQSTVRRADCTEWRVGSGGSRDGWPSAMWTKSSGEGIADGGEALGNGP